MRGGSILQKKSLKKKEFENLRFWLQITTWNPILLAWFFKITFSYKSFENKIPTPQLDIKFSNPYECWWQIFITYITRYIPLLYTHKVWRKLKDPFGTPSHPTPPHPTPSNKTFSSFQKGLFTMVFFKPREPFPIPIKWKEYSIGPLGVCLGD